MRDTMYKKPGLKKRLKFIWSVGICQKGEEVKDALSSDYVLRCNSKSRKQLKKNIETASFLTKGKILNDNTYGNCLPYHN